MIPVFEVFADGTNGIIYFIKGENVDAMLSFASIVPIAGNLVTGKRIVGMLEVKHALKSCMDVDCMKKAYNVNLPTIAKNQDLKIELGKYVKKPDLTPGVRNWEAHHIIPKGGKGVFKEMQKKLTDLCQKDKTQCIDINSAANGVWLPVKSGQTPAVDYFNIINTETRIQWKVTSHKNHSPKYGEYLALRLKNANTKDEILHEINEVRNLLLNGDINLVNPM